MLEEVQKALFTNWLEEHSSSVIKVARAYTLTSEETQDLAQEILLQAWRSLPTFEGKASPATWFYRVALHTAMNWHRKDKPRRASQKPLLEVQAVASQESDGAELVQQRELVEQLYNAIHQLPKTDAALVLLYLDELSYREMADVLGISESHVGVKLNRAKTETERIDAGEIPMNLEKYQQAWKADAAQMEVTIDTDSMTAEVQHFQQNFRSMIFWRDVREAGTSLVLIPIWFAMGARQYRCRGHFT